MLYTLHTTTIMSIIRNPQFVKQQITSLNIYERGALLHAPLSFGYYMMTYFM
jgi:hypothetical protein